MVRRFAIALLLFTSVFVHASDIVISAPSTPVEVKEPVDLPVTGLAPAELAKVKKAVSPDTARLTTRVDWDGTTYISLWARAPGRYTITLSINDWRRGIDDSLFAAKTADVPTELLAKHEALVKEYAAAFPFKTGSCVVEVAGVPFPPPVDPSLPPPIDPNSPPVNPSKISQVTFVYEKDQSFVPGPVSFALHRLNVESGFSVVATSFEEDTVDSTNQTPDQYITAVNAARTAGLPALVVQSGNVVVRVVKDPKTEQSVMDAVKETK